METDNHQCRHHHLPVEAICRSPHCGYYRELCPKCQHENQHHREHLLDLKEAVEEAKKLGNTCIAGLQGLRVNRNQQFDEKIKKNEGLTEIEDRLNELQKLILQKLNTLRIEIKRQFEQQIKEKLNKLEDVLSNSEQFLQRELQQLMQHNYKNLSMFFKQDFLQNLNYYKSYFNQIVEKKIKLFNKSLESDKIFTLITNFQQNLSNIFTIVHHKNKKEENKSPQFHLFTNQDGQCNLYSVRKDFKSINKQQIASINRIVFSNQFNNINYTWQSNPQSVFYPPDNCYYIVGEGQKVSRVIVKYEFHKGPDRGFTMIEPMETPRAHFGVCLLGNEIYIVGGENQRDGCLSSCEKVVPQYKNKIYIVHSLNQRSSRHSISTYKNKYILKFGGITTPIHSQLNQTIQAHPEIYSLESEEWSILPMKFENQLSIGLYPSIFRAQNKGILLILGGDTVERRGGYRPAFQLTFEVDKQGLNKVKVKSRLSKILYSTQIFNSTIALYQDEANCIFLKKEENSDFYQQLRLKIMNN